MAQGGRGEKGSSRLRAGRTAQDAALTPGEGRVAIQAGKRPKSSDGGVEGHALHGERATAATRRPKSVRLAQPGGIIATGAGIKPGPSEANSKRGGRPLAKDADKALERTRPWEAEGISRRTWYRRKAEERKP